MLLGAPLFEVLLFAACAVFDALVVEFAARAAEGAAANESALLLLL